MPNERFVSAMQQVTEMPSVPMRGGKKYTMVKDRVEIFRREFGDEYGIDTQVDYSQGFDTGAPVVGSAKIMDKDGRVIASGWAVEFVGSTKLTDASPVEIAETSAIGRALACFGMHGGEYASLNEMEAHERKDSFRRSNPQVGNPNLSQPITQAQMPEFRQATSTQGNGNRLVDPEAGFYVPSDHDAMWLQPEAEVDKIIDQIEEIETNHELGKYWGELKPFLNGLNKENSPLVAEIKAAFVTRQQNVGGK